MIDLRRMFLGDSSLWIVVEIVLRTTIMYLYALVMIRLMGKQGVKQLSALELIVLIALGAAIGDPMLYPDIPLLHGMAVLTTIVALERAVAYVTSRSETIDTLIQDKPRRLVVDGRLDLEGIEKESFSFQRSAFSGQLSAFPLAES